MKVFFEKFTKFLFLIYGACFILLCLLVFVLFFENINNMEDWLGFVGAIIGGAMTLIGVKWTIKEEKKDLLNQQIKQEQQRREDLAAQYRPMLLIEPLNKQYSQPGNIELKYTNVGRGEALNVTYKILEESNYLSINKIAPVKLIPEKEANTFLLILNWKEILERKNDFILNYTLELTYHDFGNLYTYCTSVYVTISYSYFYKVCRVTVAENKIIFTPNKGIKKVD